jgi:hypothetical protein
MRALHRAHHAGGFHAARVALGIQHDRSNAPPMGMRMRLKASFDISGFSPANQVILTALKQYGMILADNGSAIYISGMPDSLLEQQRSGRAEEHHGFQFRRDPDEPEIYTPVERADRAIARGLQFHGQSHDGERGPAGHLELDVTDAIYNIVSPQVGPVRGTERDGDPTATTTYRLLLHQPIRTEDRER